MFSVMLLYSISTGLAISDTNGTTTLKRGYSLDQTGINSSHSSEYWTDFLKTIALIDIRKYEKN